MSYLAPVTEQDFVLEHVAGLSALAAAPRFAHATPDVVSAILEGAAALAERKLAPLNLSGDRAGLRWSPEGVAMPEGFAAAYSAYVDGGWGSLAVPEAFGGQGLPFVLAAALLEDIGSANMAFSLIAMLTGGAIEALAAHGSPSLRETWLPRLVSGAWNGAMDITEPQAGSDVGAIHTRAMAQPDGSYRIKGGKIFITFGEHDLTDNIVHLVLARTPGAPSGTRGLSLFLVPKFRLDVDGAPGERNDVRCVSIEHKLGIHACPTCTMAFGDQDDCTGHIVGEEGGGMKAMFTMMNIARLSVGLEGVSVAERATQAALTYAAQRVQSARVGDPARTPVAIIDHPDVRRMLFRMRGLTQGARALVYYAAGQLDRAHLGDAAAKARLELLTPVAKAYASDIGCEVASVGIQVHGGMGFVEETGAAQYYRDARIAPIYEGANGIQAADLVMRKLPMNSGAPITDLLAEMRSDAVDEPTLMALLEAVEQVVVQFRGADPDDRLAGSYPLLTMLAVGVSGWQLHRQAQIAAKSDGDPAFLAMKRAVVRFHLDTIVPEATGLLAAALAGKRLLYGLSAAELAA